MRKHILKRFYYGAVVRDSTFDIKRFPMQKPASVEESRVGRCISGEDNQELLLVGTMNLSTKFAFQTKKLLEEYQPSSIYIMAPTYFEEFAKQIPKLCQTNEEFQEELENAGYHSRVLDESNSIIGWDAFALVFRYKHFMLRWFLRWIFGWPANWQDVLHPGLEAYHCLQYARENNIPIEFGAEEFGLGTTQRLIQEKKIDVLDDIWRYLNLNEMWYQEAHDHHIMMLNHSLKDLSENYVNRDIATWFTRFGKVVSDNVVEIVVDHRDESIFSAIDRRMTGDRKFALLNLWHLDGVERTWRDHKNCQVSVEAKSGLENAPIGEIKAYMDGVDGDMKKVEQMTGNTRAGHSRNLIAYDDVTRSHYA